MSCYVLLFLPAFNLDGNWAHNATRYYLSNEFIFIFNEIMHFFMSKFVFLSSMQITYLHEHTLHFQEP